MKIRKVLDKKVGGVSYFRYIITLPRKVIEESGLFGNDIEIKTGKNKIILLSK